MTEPQPNPYGLRVLSSPAQYRQQAARHPARQLVNLAEAIPGLRLDIRYATADNLLGYPLYQQAQAWLRRPVAEALKQVQQALAAHGAGLVVYDAYRPYSATVLMYQKVQNEDYAAPPWRGSRHNRGCSVDVGLVNQATGRPLPMPTAFDELSPAAHSAYEPVSSEARRHRALLLKTMAQFGFVNYPGEWWHFDYAQWAEFGLLDLSFEEL
ncbi:M15 family metallopeptidase [Hymenobacter sp. BT175]|uniref:M15 family metallopeptidase n=1 Tax=Hymenobacter translucens TaxID=2886507 RepID=UPI001D0E4DAF|nr:M15 family metallopeptidase [Hymenobacter translucens]MCC2547162.1 M15 family metallopeptidase [Hymenobacter translucens]